MNINFKDLIYHVPGFLTPDQCKQLIDEREYRDAEAMTEHCYEASTGRDTHSTFEQVVLRPETPTFELIHKSMETIINQYHDYLDTFNSFSVRYRDALVYPHMYRLMRYKKGQKLHAHTDNSLYVAGSCTFNLNDGYKGGEFKFFRGKHKVKLGRGDVMIFPADYFWVHEVTPITKGVRYSVNTFLQPIPQSVKLKVQDFTGKQDFSDTNFYRIKRDYLK